ncbi:uncharacterized protein [Drosophila virilis]|uniref:Uncharacterized protein, isoform B n=1 Tax=Drosophila virilis TaxID=7244 RepID=B4M235_DROVI|nr:uncharacterized protein LOC6631430 isoform X1 [Drosophila virilis]EDW65739.2 uncharacterized protein Dvir_GJ19419, isoform E [Drosophila virilis]KRF82392.1 uncharacterized protein Dvir_GJ19419, isoform B [Drosophila virilis]KRF82394.1 uncharacterized protein Dvir_GJ19419, isoform D [Drosophila virilis]
MQPQIVRPISTYDNLTATANTSEPKTKQQQPQLEATLSNVHSKSSTLQSYYDQDSTSLQCDLAMNVNKKSRSRTYQETPEAAAVIETAATIQDRLDPEMPEHVSELNETSHSIAAVKAALSVAKSKFFGIHNCETLDVTAPPTDENAPHAPMLAIKPEPKYQNVPQSNRIPILPEPTSLKAMKEPTNVSHRYGATYEQIPLSDLDMLQPTQAVYMSTTVPQNMKGMKIAGRHTPTRNSLRHSRMIVVNNKNHDSIQDTYSTHIRNSNLSRQLLILQLAIGLLIVGLSISIFFLTPSASILINPYLSGLSLLLASIAGLILLGRDRGAEYKRAHNNCNKVLLAESYVFSAVALIFCCLALVCAAIEFAELQNTSMPTDGSCGPATSSLLNYRNCTCLTEDQQATTPEAIAEDGTGDVGNSYSNSQSCEALRGKWKYLLGFSMSLNALGIFATFLYITIFICCHHNSRKHFNISV